MRALQTESPSPDSLFTPIRRTRSFEDVVDQVRQAIVEGRVKKGDRLPNERDLCRSFGISRSTLREGLRTLEALGAIEIRPGAAGGIFVSEPGGDQIGSALEALIRFRAATVQDLAEFRVSFEGETAFWAALRATDDDVAALDQIVLRFAELSAARAPWSVLAEVDIEFHNTVAHSSKNQVRVAIMLGIYRALRRASLSLAPLATDSLRRSIHRELARIVEAIRTRDARLARTRMRRHVKRFSDLERSAQESSSGLATAKPEAGSS